MRTSTGRGPSPPPLEPRRLEFRAAPAQTARVTAIVHANWIGGERREASTGGVFEVGERVGGLERWARSGAEDVREAIEACAVAAARWGALRRAERVARLRAVPEKLDLRTLCVALAPDLGLEPAEISPWLEEDLFRFAESVEIHEQGGDSPGVGVFSAHWSDGVGALAARVSARLLAGQAVVVLSDPRLPRAADLLARACAAADLAPGLVSVLHGDGREPLEAALDTPGLAFVRVKDLDDRLDTLSERLGPRVDARCELWRVHNSTRVVGLDDDPARAAAEVIETALGRSSTLSAQRPGQTARVLCHERLFSRFSEELLARLEGHPDVLRPVPPLEADLARHVADAWSLGLDEGATPIFGASPWDREEPTAGAAPSAGPRAPGAIVFTNVDPRSGLARLTRPAPVLSLIRAGDGDVEGLRRELDGPPNRQELR
jgi:hypothetical protein